MRTKTIINLIENCRDYDEMQREIKQLINNGDDILEELTLPVLTLLDRIKKEKNAEEQQRQQQLVKSVMNTLSFSELEIAVKIFDTLNAPEGILIAGKIGDSLGITRSVVVSALRKLESAQIIETRSLGVKGTYIKVTNPLWLDELKKLKV